MKIVYCHMRYIVFLITNNLFAIILILDAGIKFVPSFCSGLRELSVSDCTQVTDFGLYELAKLGATLRYLSVAKCVRVNIFSTIYLY